MKKTKLWTRNFRLIILVSALGAIGSIAGGFALAFLVNILVRRSRLSGVARATCPNRREPPF